jgi:hypothetical protein
MVNRIWYHHFGRGLVKELNNFGVQSESPSHPQLLDWLAVEFIRRDWSVKQIHRLILNSRTYQQSSRVTARQYELDPENRLWSRMEIRRMDAEALRDSLLMVAGYLDDRPGGIPDTVSVDRDGLVSVHPNEDGGWRRSVYLQYRRTEIPTIMDTFDYPQMGPNCVARNVSTISPQSLMLMNNAHVRELAVGLADRVKQFTAPLQTSQWGTEIRRAQIETVYQLALCRVPNEEEFQLGRKALQELQAAWKGSADHALITYCHTILNSASFLYVD